MARVLITTTLTRPGPDTPATDLGYLLHKHPDRIQPFEVYGGTAQVFYPEAGEERCTAALLLEVDPIALVRGRGRGGQDGFALGQYVNDRPYAASSLLSVALGKVFRTALKGRCDARAELAARALPLAVRVPALPTGGDPALPARLFEPLGWEVAADAQPLDPEFPEWGAAPYSDVRLTGTVRVADALNHLYVLLPVLDDAKHYWVGPDEVDKLIRAAGGWLADHPERELITRRYLAHQRGYVHTAVARLAEADQTTLEALDGDPAPTGTAATEVRAATVLATVRELGAGRVLDLGCGEGRLLQALLAEPPVTEPPVTEVAGTDVAARALDRAARRLDLDRLPEARRARVRLFQSSLVYRDTRLRGYDVAVLMEVVEHLDASRLGALERTVFADARPGSVVVTTPNSEHNVRFEALPGGSLRHRDHRFEWTRAQFGAWVSGVGERNGYAVEVRPVGSDDPEVGPPTQLAVFRREAGGEAHG